MSQIKQASVTSAVRILCLALIVSVSATGCAIIPDSMEIGMPKMPKIFGRDKQEKPDVFEEVMEEPLAEAEPAPRSRNRGRRSASTAPSSISPYAERVPSVGSRDPEPVLAPVAAAEPVYEPRPTSSVRMERSARAVSDAPLSAEAIAQMATSPKSAPRRATKTINDVQVILRKHNRIYTPKGEAPYPTVLFLHGCSGPTKSHERDWANFYTSQGYAMIAVDSVAARGLDWVDVCNQDVLNPAERAADVFASLRYARSLPIVDPDRLVLTGFAHGASTVWASLLLASGNIPPIGIATFPADALQGVRAAYMFHAPCLAPWTVDVPAINFIGEDDRYVDGKTCVSHARRMRGAEVSFDYEIFKGATHAFDHRSPNKANRDAGAAYNSDATRQAMEMIRDSLARRLK